MTWFSAFFTWYAGDPSLLIPIPFDLVQLFHRAKTAFGLFSPFASRFFCRPHGRLPVHESQV